MTFNDDIDNNTEDYESISLQKSVKINMDMNSNNNKEIIWKNDYININRQKIVCESYLYKINKKGKMKKLYFKLNNYDLFYFKNKDSKYHKGMHNLSTYFLELKPIFDKNNESHIKISSDSSVKFNTKYYQYKTNINLLTSLLI